MSQGRMERPSSSQRRPTPATPMPAAPPAIEVYSPTARAFHWLTVLLLAAQIPLGIAMSWRGNTLNIWDALTNTLYSTHKMTGLVILLVVIARLVYRLMHGAPADEPTIEPWQRIVSHITHWALYALLIAIALTGWLGVSLYPALDVFGFKLPALASPDKDAAARVLAVHFFGAVALILLAGMHVGAALFHYVIRKDGVLNRMLPGLPRRDRR